MNQRKRTRKIGKKATRGITIEESLRDSEEKYQALVENSPDLIGIIQDGVLKYVNRAATKRLGWTYEDLVSPSFDPIEKVVSERFRGLIKENVGKRLRGEDAPPYEISLTTRDGSEIPVIVRAAKIVYRGRPAIEFAFNDISERKLMEKELSKSSQFLGSVIENAYVWLTVLDNEQSVIVWNKAAEAMSGYSREEVVGHGKIWEWLYPDQEYRKQITETVTDVLLSGRTDVDVETKIKRKDGQTRIISWNERALTDQDGRAIGTIAIGHDTTELREMHDELERYSNHLQESEEKLRALHQHALQLGSASNIEEIVKSTLDAIEFALGFDVVDVYVAAGDSLRVRGTRGAPIGFSEEHLGGRGLVAKAARSQAPVRVSDTTKEPDYLDRKGRDWTGPHTALSELAVPVVVNAETVAVLNAESIRLNAFSDEDRRLLETLAAHVGSEMQRLKHEEKIETYSKHLEALVEERTGKLVQSEERYRSIVQNIPGMVWTSNEKGDTVFITPNVKELFGHTPEEIYSGGELVWSKHIHPDDRAKLNEAYDALFADGGVFDVEYRYQRPDGKWLWLNDRADLVHEKDGVRYTDGVTTDITERKRAEEDLKESRQQLHEAKERLEYVIASNPAVLYLETPLPDLSDTLVTFVSESATSVLGFEPKNFLGESGLNFWRSRIHPDDLARYSAEMPSLWRDGQHTFEYRFLHRDGTYRWIRDEYRVIRDGEGRILDIATVAVDVTERVKLYEKLAKAERLAAIGETAAMVGHDLRNPLQGIAGATAVLRKRLGSAPDEVVKEMLDVLDQDVKYSDKIVADLLEYSGEIRLAPAETTLKHLIEESLSIVPPPNGVTVKDLTDGVKILVDSQQIKRVFINLIKNAYDAMPNGGEVRITSTNSNGILEVSFSDTGEGIKEEVIQKLWKGPVTTKAKGLGLGLAISKRIIETHGGTMAALQGSNGRGTEVKVKLPIKHELGGV